MTEVFIKKSKLPVDDDKNAIKDWLKGEVKVSSIDIGDNYVVLKGAPEPDDLPAFVKKVAEHKCRLTKFRGVDRVVCWGKNSNKIESNEVF